MHFYPKTPNFPNMSKAILCYKKSLLSLSKSNSNFRLDQFVPLTCPPQSSLQLSQMQFGFNHPRCYLSLTVLDEVQLQLCLKSICRSYPQMVLGTRVFSLTIFGQIFLAFSLTIFGQIFLAYESYSDVLSIYNSYQLPIVSPTNCDFSRFNNESSRDELFVIVMHTNHIFFYFLQVSKIFFLN